MKVFVGGIGHESNWREEFNTAAQGSTIELVESGSKNKCDHLLYVVTPMMKDISSIVNVVNDSNHEKGKTILCSLNEEGDSTFTSHQQKSLVATGKMVELNGGKWFTSLKDTVQYITSKA